MNLPVVILIWVLSISAAAGFSYNKGYHNGNLAGSASIQKKWDEDKKRLEAEYAASVAKAQKNTTDAQATADKLQREKNDANKKIVSLDTALRNSLRNRPDRRTENSTVPPSSGSCAGSTGAELANRDAEFLAGYLADVERLQAAVDQCAQQYNDVQQRINKE